VISKLEAGRDQFGVSAAGSFTEPRAVAPDAKVNSSIKLVAVPRLQRMLELLKLSADLSQETRYSP